MRFATTSWALLAVLTTAAAVQAHRATGTSAAPVQAHRATVISAAAAPLPRAAAITTSHQQGDITRLQWLAGCWLRENGSTSTEEQWMRPGAGMMLGMSRTIRDGRVLEHEALRIYSAADGALIFAAAPSNQLPAEFRAVAVSSDSAAFVNAAHDFPQRIVYRRVGADSVQATIEGPRNGTTRRIDFDYARVRCD